MLINFSYFCFGFLLDLRRKEATVAGTAGLLKFFSCLDTCVMYITNGFYED